MVVVKKDPTRDYTRCLNIFRKYFYVDQDGDSIRLYRLHSKYKIIQIVKYIMDNSLGWTSIHYDKTIDIYGNPELFREVSDELEREGFEVSIYW
jgi:hypothetical protein